MTHTEALNKMLANTCASRTHGNLSEFHIDLHCNTARVVARLTDSPDEGPITYDIVRMEIV